MANKKKSGDSANKKPVITQQPSSTPKTLATTGTSATARATKERREERKQQERRQRNTLIVIAVVAVIVAIGAIYLVTNLPQEAPIPDGTQTRYEGIPQTYNIENGMPMLGKPDAPVQVVSYTSFACPSCQQFHGAMNETIVELIRAGIMSYTIIPQENGEITNGNGAARGALCAAEQGKFFEFADVLFSWQEIYVNQAFGQNRMFAGADALGMDGGAFRSCIGSGRIFDLYAKSQDLRLQRGITGTPRTYINGIEYTGALTDRITFENTVRQTYQQTGRVAIPIETNTDTPVVDTTPEATPVVEATAEATPEATLVVEATVEATPETTPVVEATPETETTAEATPSN